MRVLKKKVQKAGIVKEARERQYFMKPSEKKREVMKTRAITLKKAQKKNDEMLGYQWIKGVKIKKI